MFFLMQIIFIVLPSKMAAVQNLYNITALQKRQHEIQEINTTFPLQAIKIVTISTPASLVMCNLLAASSSCNALSLI